MSRAASRPRSAFTRMDEDPNFIFPGTTVNTPGITVPLPGLPVTIPSQAIDGGHGAPDDPVRQDLLRRHAFQGFPVDRQQAPEHIRAQR